MKDIFISYSHDDEFVAFNLKALCETRGHSVWVDRDSILGGANWARAIAQGILDCRLFVVLLSKKSVVSNNVLNEIGFAAHYDKIILPVYIDTSIGALPIELQLRIARFQHIAIDNDDLILRTLEEILGKPSNRKVGSNWIVSNENDVLKVGRSYAFSRDGTLTKKHPVKPPFSISGEIEIATRLNDKIPDVRIYLTPSNATRRQECFVIFPWEHTEMKPGWLECHVDLTIGNDVIRLYQKEVCEFNELPMKYVFEMRVTDRALEYRTSAFSPDVNVDIGQIKELAYPISSPQHIRIVSRNCQMTLRSLKVS